MVDCGLDPEIVIKRAMNGDDTGIASRENSWVSRVFLGANQRDGIEWKTGWENMKTKYIGNDVDGRGERAQEIFLGSMRVAICDLPRVVRCGSAETARVLAPSSFPETLAPWPSTVDPPPSIFNPESNLG
jgi:hypothetical protein